jgi:putative DNA primase/helicase
MSELLQAALQYAGRGWRVFPIHTISPATAGCTCGKACASPGKHPRVKGGFKAATVAPAQIEAWWGRWPDANIGIATGTVSGLIVFDLDGAQGLDIFRMLCAGHTPVAPPALWVKTGRGLHLYYGLAPGEGIIPCSSGNGLDVRGDGGYVLAPPSRHPSGAIYAWGGVL